MYKTFYSALIHSAIALSLKGHAIDGHSRWQQANTVISSVFTFQKAVSSKNALFQSDAQIGALKDLFITAGGPDWNCKTNWMTPNTQVATWFGVSINSDGNVTGLELGTNNLNGIHSVVDVKFPNARTMLCLNIFI